MQFVESNSPMTLRCTEKVWEEAGDMELARTFLTTCSDQFFLFPRTNSTISLGARGGRNSTGTSDRVLLSQN